MEDLDFATDLDKRKSKRQKVRIIGQFKLFRLKANEPKEKILKKSKKELNFFLFNLAFVNISK